MSNKNFKNQSYRNYGQYSKQNEENEKTVVSESVNVESNEKTVVPESANIESTNAEGTAEKATDKFKTSFGMVNCSRLNIRKRPDIDSDPLCVVEKDCKLEVDSNYQNDDWIKVTTPDGVSGYCMLKFVDLK